MSEKIDLSSLILATAQGTNPPPNKQAATAKLKTTMHARLMAQEYVRNGMNLSQAYTTVTGMKARGNMHKMLRGEEDIFLNELSQMVEAARIDQAAVLNRLWTLINSSIFDFFDDKGEMLTVAEIKKLPRVYQTLIEYTKIKTVQLPVRDDAGKIMVDDNGNPYLRQVQEVELRIPPKLVGIELLAKIMKWIGPNIVINNNTTNIANVMQEKSQQRRMLESHYANVIEGETVPSESDPRQP